MKHLRYLQYVIRHKYYVFKVGRITKAPLWNLIIHDWSKFTPAEWFPYVERFYGAGAWNKDTSKKELDVQAFRYAFLHHIHRNPHHWEYWVLKRPQPMPTRYVQEMVADWFGAGYAQKQTWEAKEWYGHMKDKINLHPETRLAVEWLLDYVHYRLHN